MSLDEVLKIRISKKDYARIKLLSKSSQFKNISCFCRHAIMNKEIYTMKSVVDANSNKIILAKISALIKKTLGEGITIENRKKLNAAIEDLKKLSL